MCGIAGFLLSPRERRIDTARLARMLHVGIDPRGGDATGAAWIDPSQATHHFTVVGRAREFRSAHPNAAHNASMAILHTRFATQGDKNNPLNNHPVNSGHFYAVHNGHLYNDDEIFATIPVPRRGEVDSEAAVAMIRYASMKGEDVWRALERLEGRAALAWFDSRDPHTLHLARGSSSPLVVAQTRDGSVVFASTKPALLEAMKAVGMEPDFMMDVNEGVYMAFRDGRMMEMHTWKPNPGSWSSRFKGYAPDQGGYVNKPSDKYSWANEPFVLGARGAAAAASARAAARRAERQGKVTTLRAADKPTVSADLVPYEAEVYDLAFNRKPSIHDVSTDDDTDLHDLLMNSTDLDVVPSDDWHWDDQDLYHAAIRAAGIDSDTWD